MTNHGSAEGGAQQRWQELLRGWGIDLTQVNDRDFQVSIDFNQCVYFMYIISIPGHVSAQVMGLFIHVDFTLIDNR
jgi:hypothetical protein